MHYNKKSCLLVAVAATLIIGSGKLVAQTYMPIDASGLTDSQKDAFVNALALIRTDTAMVNSSTPTNTGVFSIPSGTNRIVVEVYGGNYVDPSPETPDADGPLSFAVEYGSASGNQSSFARVRTIYKPAQGSAAIDEAGTTFYGQFPYPSDGGWAAEISGGTLPAGLTWNVANRSTTAEVYFIVKYYRF